MHLKSGKSGKMKMVNKKGSVGEIVGWAIIILILILALQQIGWIK